MFVSFPVPHQQTHYHTQTPRAQLNVPARVPAARRIANHGDISHAIPTAPMSNRSTNTLSGTSTASTNTLPASTSNATNVTLVQDASAAEHGASSARSIAPTSINTDSAKHATHAAASSSRMTNNISPEKYGTTEVQPAPSTNRITSTADSVKEVLTPVDNAFTSAPVSSTMTNNISLEEYGTTVVQRPPSTNRIASTSDDSMEVLTAVDNVTSTNKDSVTKHTTVRPVAATSSITTTSNLPSEEGAIDHDTVSNASLAAPDTGTSPAEGPRTKSLQTSAASDNDEVSLIMDKDKVNKMVVKDLAAQGKIWKKLDKDFRIGNSKDERARNICNAIDRRKARN